MHQGEMPLLTWMKESLPKATSFPVSSDIYHIHMAACGAASRDYVFDSPEL